MGDTWINRLVVSGPIDDVEAFALDAAPVSPGARARGSLRRRHLALSFVALARNVGLTDADEPSEPFEVIAEGPGDLGNGMARRVYRFELGGYEADKLLLEATAKYPRLYLVLGWVAPSVDEQASKLIHRRRERHYELSAKHKHAIYGSTRDDDSDDALWAEVEADRKALDKVVRYWDVAVGRILKLMALRRTAKHRPG